MGMMDSLKTQCAKSLTLLRLQMQLRASLESEREAAVKELGATRYPEVLDTLIRMASDKAPNVRRVTATSLGQIGDPRALQALLMLLRDSKQGVKKAALLALGEIGNESAVDPLVDALRDLDPDMRRSAADALVKIGPKSLEPLLKLLDEREEFIRREAIRALGLLGQAEAITPLVNLLRTREADRSHVAKALMELGWQPSAPEDRILFSFARGKFDEPVAEGRSAVSPLIAALSEKSVDVRKSSARALGEIGDARAVEPLIAALSDPSSVVREAAARALGNLGDTRAIEPLSAALADEEHHVRPVAAKSLGQIGDLRAIDALAAALMDKRPMLRKSAAEALVKLGPEAMGPLLEALHDPENHTRIVAVEALGQLGDPRAVGPLSMALKDKEDVVRKEAVRALVNIRDPFIMDPLMGALHDASLEVRQEAIRALGNIGDPFTVQALLPLVQDRELIELALESLIKILKATVSEIVPEDMRALHQLTVDCPDQAQFAEEYAALRQLVQAELTRRGITV